MRAMDKTRTPREWRVDDDGATPSLAATQNDLGASSRVHHRGYLRQSHTSVSPFTARVEPVMMNHMFCVSSVRFLARCKGFPTGRGARALA